MKHKQAAEPKANLLLVHTVLWLAFSLQLSNIWQVFLVLSVHRNDIILLYMHYRDLYCLPIYLIKKVNKIMVQWSLDITNLYLTNSSV